MNGRHARPDLGIIVGEPLLGDAGVRPVDPVGMGEPDRAAAVGLAGVGRRRHSRTTSSAGLSSRRPRKEAWRTMPSAVQVAELDLGDKLGPHEATPARLLGVELLAANGLFAMRIRSSRLNRLGRHLAGEAGADAAGIDQLAVLVDSRAPASRCALRDVVEGT